MEGLAPSSALCKNNVLTFSCRKKRNIQGKNLTIGFIFRCGRNLSAMFLFAKHSIAHNIHGMFQITSDFVRNFAELDVTPVAFN